MDHIQDLSVFQGVILSADNLHSFSKLKSKGGNEEKVEYVVEKLSNFLKEKNYITEDGVVKEKYGEYQKLALYIVLNADLPILEEMTEMEGMESVIWMLPTVPAYLLCEIFWNLHMQQFLYEIIAFCNPNLALQVADAFIANMKYLNPVEHLDRVRLVSGALYRLVCRLHFRATDAALLTAALNSFQICLNNFINPPNAEKVLALTRDLQYQYLGRSLTSMLHLIEDCLDHFTTIQQFEAEGFSDIYLSTHPPESITTKTLNFKICESPVPAILECLNKCNTFLLDDCTTQVMSISVDIFCAWSEYEENGRSMQQTIGELCFRMGSILQSIPSASEHTLVGMLKQISRRPVDLKDIINETATDTILEKVNAHDEESASWVAALLHRDDLCQHLDLLLLIESKLSMINEEQSLQLYEKIIDHLRNDNENNEYLKVLAIKAFQRCTNTVKENIVSDQFSDCMHDNLENGDFSNTMTEIFNKLTVATDADPSDIWTVFLQNPKRTFLKIFKLAAENAKQADIMLRIVKFLEKYRDHYYQRDTEPCVIKVTHAVLASPEALDTDAKRDNFVNFLSELKRRDIIVKNKLLLLIVMPHLHRGLSTRDMQVIVVQVRLLRVAFTIAELLSFRAPVLAVLAQALDAARWDATGFDAAMPAALDLILDLQKQMFDTYEAEIPEKELQWLRSKVDRAHPLTKCHFAPLWGGPPPAPPATPKIPATCREIINQNFMAVLSLSAREWSALLPRGAGDGAGEGEGGLGLDALHEALLKAARAERSRRTPRTWACLLHGYRNFATTIKNNYFTEPPTDEQVTTVIDKLVTSANLVDPEYSDDFSSAWLPLLAHVATARRDLCSVLAEQLRTTVAGPALAGALARPLEPVGPDLLQ